jgi:hypothetical protein
MAKKESSLPKGRVTIFEDEEIKSIWTYDYSVTRSGPISVEIIYKNEPEMVTKKRKTKKK